MADEISPRVERSCATCKHALEVLGEAWDEDCLQGVNLDEDDAWHGDNDQVVHEWRAAGRQGACPMWVPNSAVVPGLEAEVDRHEAATRRVGGLLQRASAALRALDAEVQAGSWRGAEQHLGAPLSDQSLRGLADHLDAELRREGRPGSVENQHSRSRPRV